MTRPIVRLRPKTGKRLREGAPWAYANEVVMDRRTKALPPGVIVELQDAERTRLGTAAFNPSTTLAVRLLDPDPAAEIDRAWFTQKLRGALALRERLYDAPFYRLAHAEGDGLPGVVIDRFGATAAIQPNAAWADALLPELAAALAEATGVDNIVMNGASRVRKLEGLAEEVTVLKGAVDAPIPTPMNGATYMADLIGGQKTGLFFDQRPNHAFAARLARGEDVLDVFSHVGGFSLAALAAGAASALAVDGSEPALDLAEAGAKASYLSGLTTLKSDAFDAMRGLAEEGRRFGLVVADPPAFAPNRGALDAGLRAYAKTARLAAALVGEGGCLVLCSCSGAVDAEAFLRTSIEGIRAAGRAGALIHKGGAGPDHPMHIALPETAYLKTLFIRLTP